MSGSATRSLEIGWRFAMPLPVALGAVSVL